MSKLSLFFLYCDFPEIIGTHLVHPWLQAGNLRGSEETVRTAKALDVREDQSSVAFSFSCISYPSRCTVYVQYV